ncbi:hypothetical protein D9758_003926 [Tetrapyrgos nigripes]|uniref:DNA-directed DNA polymerase n=1 Tax=Tetrapyrgos nigripes TaxID=182062 RepID=A0A8H5GM03_9AGAR|nr:hypothetical protein D9758_003926 [Tetrapyrgos nigripes]
MTIDFDLLPEPSTSKEPVKRAVTTIIPTTSDSKSASSSKKTSSTSTDLPNLPSFRIDKAHRSYKHQYSNIYFVRLRILRQYVEESAKKRWADVPGNPLYVPRVLEIVKTKLCWIVGTVYMDMPLKPNILEDISREHGLPPLPPANYSSISDKIMLEDESGRILLQGDLIQTLINEDSAERTGTNANVSGLVTGVILAALGKETQNGEFEVVDLCYGGMPPQPSLEASKDEDEMDVDNQPDASSSSEEKDTDTWIAFVSGLSINEPSPADVSTQLLIEYLSGEAAGLDDQVSTSRISRLVIAGDSLASMVVTGKGEADADGIKRSIKEKKEMVGTKIARGRKYGYDSTTFSPHPTRALSAHLLDLGRVMPVHILPGEHDPAGTILPQQPFPRGMFGDVSAFPTFSSETNPTWVRLSAPSPSPSKQDITRTFLVHSGQPVNDMFKYLPSPASSSTRVRAKLDLAESSLRWRHIAPTAPDTLWCHPYFDRDPFILEQTPDIYAIGGQESFGTRLVEEFEDEDIKRCRIVLLPSFAKTGTLVLVNMRTLGVKTVKFAVKGMTGDGQDVEIADETVKKEEPEAEPRMRSPDSPDSIPDSSNPASQMY